MSRPRRHTAATTAAAVLAILMVGPALAADWPMFGGGPLHAGTTEDIAPASAALKWSADIGGSVDSSPAVVGGRVFVGTSEGAVCCLDATDGRPLWTRKTGGAVVSSPSVSDGRVFVGSADRFLYALDAAKGSVVWRCRTWGPVVGSPVSIGDRVLFGSMDGSLRAVSATTGQLLWRTPKGSGISTAAVVVGESVVYADEAGAVLAVALADGHALWQAKVAGPVMASPSVSGNTLLVPAMAPTALSPICIDYLVAFDLNTGGRLWGLRDPKGESVSATTTPAVGAGVCYLATTEGYLSDSRLRCVDIASGKLSWQGSLDGVADSCPVVSGGTVFHGCHDGSLWSWSATTGRPIARLPLDKRVYSSPAIAGNRIYIGAQGGKLLCLG